MSVSLTQTTAMWMPPVLMVLVALCAHATADLKAMVSTAQVRSPCEHLQKEGMSSTCSLTYFYYLCMGWLSARMVHITWWNHLYTCRHWWVWTQHRQLPCECPLYWCDWSLCMHMQQWVWRKWNQLHKYVGSSYNPCKGRKCPYIYLLLVPFTLVFLLLCGLTICQNNE